MIKLNKQYLLKNRTVPLAVSMGVDSVAAAIYLKKKGYSVKCFHFNHGLRDQNFLMEEKFVDFCERFGFDYFIGKNIEKLKTESEFRVARIRFFVNNVTENFVCTAHHLDDYVENYLLNCLRGHPEYKPIEECSNWGKFKIIHPFLLTEKKDFQKYLDYCNELVQYRGVKDFVVEDETNSENKGSRRNWLRNNIIPELEKNKINLKTILKKKI